MADVPPGVGRGVSTLEAREVGRAELFHTTCCEDDDLALCGLDVTDLPFTNGEGESWCVVCEDLLDTDDCPKFRRCRA